MNCLYISYDGALEPLGQSQIIAYLKCVSEKDIKFTLVTFDKKNLTDASAAGPLKEELKASGIEWVSLRYHKYPPVVSTLIDMARVFMVGSALAAGKKVSVVHARGYVSALPALFLKKIFGLKFIFDSRGFWPDLKAECGHWRKNGMLHRAAKFFERVFVNNADSIVVLSQKAKDIIVKQNARARSISVIPCCADGRSFKIDMEARKRCRQDLGLSDKFVLAHIGSLESWYVLDRMLDFFRELKNTVGRAHFLVLSRSAHESVMRLALERNIDRDDISVMGVDFKQVPGILQAVDAGLIFLSLGGSRAGCCPTKFAEFLSCGVPVVANSGIGDIDRIVSENRVGVIINDFGPKAYQQAAAELRQLVAESGLRSRCLAAADKELSLVVGAARYRDVYTGLMR